MSEMPTVRRDEAMLTLERSLGPQKCERGSLWQSGITSLLKSSGFEVFVCKSKLHIENQRFVMFAYFMHRGPARDRARGRGSREYEEASGVGRRTVVFRGILSGLVVAAFSRPAPGSRPACRASC